MILDYIFLFTDNDVDGEAFVLLQEEDFLHMMPTNIGARRKLISKQRIMSGISKEVISNSHVSEVPVVHKILNS